MAHNSSVRRAYGNDGEHSVDDMVLLLRREARQLAVMLRATTGLLKRRQESLRILQRRKLTLHAPSKHEAA